MSLIFDKKSRAEKSYVVFHLSVCGSNLEHASLKGVNLTLIMDCSFGSGMLDGDETLSVTSLLSLVISEFPGSISRKAEKLKNHLLIARFRFRISPTPKLKTSQRITIRISSDARP